jgi:hypothetical protein
MVSNSKQNWTVGNTVKVGFLVLVVKAAIATPGDYLPDAYILTNVTGTKLYKFVPHNGLQSITVADARELMAIAEAHAARVAAQAIAKASSTREIDALFA